ncbi:MULTISPECIES: restriction endonuclease subunit S [Pseudomonas]|uniref:restriction endonuclease subunit S n=1 Tax=Pseudomonas TaxID=286 RepID=UPI0009F5BEA1|nr:MULTISPECIES: restriction endonuclease subunit S [Pseudomonas]RUE54169.1 restriction endonuclease subunit S [Pseudomonas aeruginosa]HCT2655931.1 restriction endonuclease subunit S [Pseudomonas aeruginosa]HEP9718916.1 restriction endonuclease subunit S [Pseudomonas aeruginosa]HEP9725856.1 restriction endonuclease subunit S [Pseudomonas aeruginosa]HEQ0195809.1 restriction endonuclease subunit S [Pseudomonas aeruginosa]
MSWPISRLGEVISFIRGVTFTPEDQVEPFSEGSTVVMRTKNVQVAGLDQSDLIAVPSGFVRRKEQALREGDILVSSANSWELVGKASYVPKLAYEATAGGFISIVRAKESRVDSRYLYHWVACPATQHKIRHCGRQTTNISNLDVGRFQDLEIPLPPLPEQKRIAAILDKADAIRRKRQQAIQLADDFLRAVFLDMFGDPVTNPKGWDVKRIEEVAAKDKYAIKAGPFGSALKKEDYVPEGYKIYGQEQVIRDDLEYGDYFINEEKYESLASCSVSEGDVLISLVGSFGKVSVVPKDYHPGIINPRLMKIRFNESCASPWYMKYLLTTKEMIKKIEGMSHGGTMGILNVGKIRDLEVINPPLNLQESFLKISTQVRSIKARCELVAAHPLFDSLSQKAFSGQL